MGIGIMVESDGRTVTALWRALFDRGMRRGKGLKHRGIKTHGELRHGTRGIKTHGELRHGELNSMTTPGRNRGGGDKHG